MDLKPLVDTFESTILRNVAPSSAFFVIFGLGNLLGAALNPLPWRTPLSLWESWTHWLHTFSAGKPTLIVFAAGFAILVGTSYVLAMLQNLLIDNTLKYRFEKNPLLSWHRLDTSVFSVRENNELILLRKEVIRLINTHPGYKEADGNDQGEALLPKDFSDFLLYELIKDLFKVSTRDFVDEAKAVGIVCLSIAITAPVISWIYWETWYNLLFSLLLAAGFWFLGRELAKSLYRHRAFRLYIKLINRSIRLPQINSESHSDEDAPNN